MKALVSVFLLAVLPLQAAPVFSAHVKTVLLEKLSAYQDKVDGLYAVANGQLRVGHHTVDLAPFVESEGSSQGKSIVAMRVEVSVDGVQRPEFTFGAIGISTDSDDAVAVGLGEWYMAFARPLFESIGEKKAGLTVADYDVFVGALGLRGDAAAGWLDGSGAMTRRILGEVGTALSGQQGFVTLDLKVMVPASGRPQSECRMSGIVSVEIASRLIALDWPRTVGGYMFKQAFVLKRKKPDHAQDQSVDVPPGSNVVIKAST